MNVALIFAGGTGRRMNTKSTPKQFLKVYGKPILAYTLEKFQHSHDIDAIILVSLSDWIDYAWKIVDQYRLDKVSSIVAGGATGQESIYNGLKEAERLYPSDAIMLIHDGVRPIVEEETIAEAIASVREYGSAITVSPAIETVIISGKDDTVNRIMDRSDCFYAKAPQCFYLKDLIAAHRRAIADGIETFIDSASLMDHYGHSLHTVHGPANNIKITTPTDYYLFKALVDAKENADIFS